MITKDFVAEFCKLNLAADIYVKGHEVQPATKLQFTNLDIKYTFICRSTVTKTNEHDKMHMLP